MSKIDEYTYGQSIGSSHIRLLQPVTIDEQCLSFRLLHVQRNAAPAYTAVSYTWGNDVPSETIMLDGRLFRVRPNLWSCLYYLGLFSHDAEWKYLWVDAICIDQRNDQERNDQVSRMDKTYRDATCVSVWLGLAPQEPELLHSPTKILGSSSFDWVTSLHDLASRSYWSRCWVIQEYKLGKHVQLHCSDSSVHWYDFQELLCHRAGIEPFGDKHTRPLPDADLAALPLALSRQATASPVPLLSLAELLVTHCRSQCKDPRDRIFSLLGLVHEEERRRLNKFFPDYQMDENIVRVITLAHLMEYGSIDDPNLAKLTPDSNDIFTGLGASNICERKVLLGLVKDFEYYPEWIHQELRISMEIDALRVSRDEAENKWVAYEWTHMNDSRESSWIRWLGVPLSLTLGVGIWWASS